MSQHIEKLLKEIYADSKVSPGEIMQLRQAVTAHAERVLTEVGHEGVLAALTKSFDVTTQLLQESLLRMRKEGTTDMGKAATISLIEAYISLLQANLTAFRGDS